MKLIKDSICCQVKKQNNTNENDSDRISDVNIDTSKVENKKNNIYENYVAARIITTCCKNKYNGNFQLHNWQIRRRTIDIISSCEVLYLHEPTTATGGRHYVVANLTVVIKPGNDYKITLTLKHFDETIKEGYNSLEKIIKEVSTNQTWLNNDEKTQFEDCINKKYKHGGTSMFDRIYTNYDAADLYFHINKQSEYKDIYKNVNENMSLAKSLYSFLMSESTKKANTEPRLCYCEDIEADCKKIITACDKDFYKFWGNSDRMIIFLFNMGDNKNANIKYCRFKVTSNRGANEGWDGIHHLM
jgi:hypothetical protein